MAHIIGKLSRICQKTVRWLSPRSLSMDLKDLALSLASIVVIIMGLGQLLSSSDVISGRLYRGAALVGTPEISNTSSNIKDDTALSDQLYKRVRVLCMIMASRETLWTRAIHVNATWGKRCNKILFMTDVSDVHFPSAVGVYTSTGRHFLTQKVFESFDYIYDHHFKDADWFMKCDDDTYVIMENLRHFLTDKNSKEAVFFGQHFRNTKRINYFTGGAGYILSKQALHMLKHRDPKICKATWEGANEDVRTSECLTRSGAKMGRSLDDLGRTRFHAFPPWTHMEGDFPTWYKFRSVFGVQKGKDSMSPYAISFHKFESSASLYLLDYFVYTLRPYGINFGEPRTIQ